MRPLLTPEEMRRADEAAIASGTPGHVLMERAGRAVARVVARTSGRRYGSRVVVVCGKGNNAGDGYAAARVMHGWGMTVLCAEAFGEPPSGDAAEHRRRAERAGVRLVPFAPELLDGSDVVVDAIFGTGFRPPAKGEAAAAIEAIAQARGCKVVAIDIPSGLDGETGRTEGPWVPADVTVAMAAEKTGTVFAPAEMLVQVASIGIPVTAASAYLAGPQEVAANVPRRHATTHKGSAGVVAVLAGSPAYPGAAALAARAAARAGAGYVLLGSTSEVLDVVRTRCPEVVGTEVALGPGALDAFADALGRADVVAAGPGLGTGDAQAALVERLVAEVEAPLVLDADALNVLAGRTETLAARTGPAIVTPHPAELGRLLEWSTDEIQSDRLAAATEAAQRLRCVVVLKGHRTVVASPQGPRWVIPTGGPELASAGTGDVLTGTIAACVLHATAADMAAVAGAYVHGLAGTIARERLGVTRRTARGVLASDVIDALPEAFARAVEVTA